MRILDLVRFKGQICVFMLVNGTEVTAKVTDVSEITETVVLSKPRMFVPTPSARNPAELSVACLPVGYPLHQADESLRIDAAHIIMIFTPNPDMVNAYIQKTSGIVAAPAGALDGLAGLDFSKVGHLK